MACSRMLRFQLSCAESSLALSAHEKEDVDGMVASEGNMTGSLKQF